MALLLDAITTPLKAASDAAEKILQVKGILEFGDEIRELHANVVSGLKAARGAEIEQATMQREIEALKSKVADLETNKAKLERYELRKLPPGVIVYALKEAERGTEPDHYACEPCFNKGQINRLHPGREHSGLTKLTCGTCKTEFEIGFYAPPQPVRVNTRYNPLVRR